MKKRALKITAFIAALILPFIAIGAAGVISGDVYAETYYAALIKQCDRMDSVTGERVVLLGNSNVAFGVDSELFESLYGVPLVSFGLYGSFGTKLMLDLSKRYVRRGDVIVIALEEDEKAYALNFGASAALKAFETRPDLLLATGYDNYESLLASVPMFFSDKYSYAVKGEKPTNDGVYKNRSVNAYGEIERGLRTGSVMRTGYLDEKIMVSPDSIGGGFIDYLNDYLGYCKSLGAAVLYSFSPMNGKAVAEQGVTEGDIYDFYDYLTENLDCPVISDPNAYVFDQGYFYDTNFHLNDSGVILRTVQLVRDLHLFYKVSSAVNVDIPAPPAPEVTQVEIDKTLDYTPSEFFTYKQSGEYLTVVGVTERAKALSEIVVPVMHDGKYVVKVGSYAFDGCVNLKKLTIPVGISELSSFALSDCTALKEIVVLAGSGNDLTVYYDSFTGVDPSCKIVLINAKRSDFLTGYFWSQVRLEIVGAD